MRNFDYLKDLDGLKELYERCHAAEEAQRTDPDVSVFQARRALEFIVHEIYKLKNISYDPHDPLLNLLTGEPFVSFVANDQLMRAAHYVRKIGNHGVHQGGVKTRESFFTVLNLYNLVGAILLKLQVIDELKPFDKDLIPSGGVFVPRTKPQTVKEEPEVHVLQVPEEVLAAPAPVVFNNDFTEAETRKFFIDLLLREAGWEVLTTDGAVLPGKACVEVEIEGMPNQSQVGYADYVLFGANGKPLAVVEAKRTSKDPAVGRHQAELYAEGLEKKYGVRPVIYYTNGYQTFIIDRLGYPPRETVGFHTEADLELLLQRQGREAIKDLHIQDAITNREYQKRAIRSVCEHLNTLHRRALLVMATGTGKTRVAISLVDVLMRNNWIKRVLFLADRNALVNQAAKNFGKLLPAATVTKLSENSNPDLNARIVFSTYQTMIGYIDREEKDFSIGRFDLIIIDEAHRSVYGKYTAIFDYFDSLLVGLTATPRDEVDRSTYDLFGLESGEPNFAYEYEEAVKDGYLVDFNPIARTTGILKNGIRYDSLSPEEKEQLEQVWKYEAAQADLDLDAGLHARNINSSEIFKYIFNLGTIDKVLADLMQNGLKVQQGDRIGKTIIFAYNHKHAELIVERFHYLYPHLGADFCVLIDNTVNYAQDLINKLEVRNKLPQIAVSVDMLDTGIDVPDILNLVFFKPVHSYIKFWQMIGRGTRLSPDIFDLGQDKQEFYLFDWCGNLEFFGAHPEGHAVHPQISLTERLFGFRLDLAHILQHAEYQKDPEAKKLHDELKTRLQQQVIQLNDHHIAVRKHIKEVDHYRKLEAWTDLTAPDVLELKTVFGPLLSVDPSNEGAKKFDALLLYLQLSLVNPEIYAGHTREKVVGIAQALQEKASIPQVMAKMDLIQHICRPQYWEQLSLGRLEYVRLELRDLIQFLSGGSHPTFTVNITDTVEVKEAPEVYHPHVSYRQRVLDYLAENKDLPVIRKIQRIEQLDRNDILTLERIFWKDLGSKEDYEKFVKNGNLLCGDRVAAFLRAQVGIDRQAAVEKLSSFLSTNNLNSRQEEFLKCIITYVCQNGDITKETLVNESPFDEFNIFDIFGEKLSGVAQYVDALHNSITVA